MYIIKTPFQYILIKGTRRFPFHKNRTAKVPKRK